MNRRTFLGGASAAMLATFVTAGAARPIDSPGGDTAVQFVATDCDCDGTYEACCVNGPCDCTAVRTIR